MSDPADLARLERKLDHALVAILHLLMRHPDMTASRADVLSALDATDQGLKTLGTNIVALGTAHAAASQPEDLSDILTRIQNQGAAVTTLNGAVEAALAPAVEAPAVEPAPVETTVAEAPVEQPAVAPVAPIGLVIPGTVG